VQRGAGRLVARSDYVNRDKKRPGGPQWAKKGEGGLKEEAGVNQDLVFSGGRQGWYLALGRPREMGGGASPIEGPNGGAHSERGRKFCRAHTANTRVKKKKKGKPRRREKKISTQPYLGADRGRVATQGQWTEHKKENQQLIGDASHTESRKKKHVKVQADS